MFKWVVHLEVQHGAGFPMTCKAENIFADTMPEAEAKAKALAAREHCTVLAVGDVYQVDGRERLVF